MSDAGHVIRSLDELRALYGEPSERAVKKELTRLDRHCRNLIAISPFMLLATSGADGRMDCSPRGDGPGFVQVPDDRTLIIPDRKGNNRLDSLGNILAHPRVGVLFLVPGMDETLRINGSAVISRDPGLLDGLAFKGKPPRTAIVVTVEEAFLQCAKALVRSRLWDPDAQIERKDFPSMGRMLADQIGGLDAEEFDRQSSRMAKTGRGLY